MKRLGEGFYGRAAAYSAAIGRSDRDALAEAIKRNVYDGADPGPRALAALTDYALRQPRQLDGQTLASIANGELAYAPLEAAAV